MKKIVVMLLLYLLHTRAMDLKTIVVTMNGERVELPNYERVRAFDYEFHVENIKALRQSPILASQLDDCADQSDVTCCIEYNNSALNFKKFFYPMQVLTRLDGLSDEDFETTKINQYLTKYFSCQKLRQLIEHVSLADYLAVEPLTQRLVSNITERATELATDYRQDATLLDPLTGNIKERIARAIAAQKAYRVLLKELRPLPLPIVEGSNKNTGIKKIKWCSKNNSFFVVEHFTNRAQQYKIKRSNNRTYVEVVPLSDQVAWDSGITVNSVDRTHLSEKPYVRIANIVDSDPGDVASNIYFAHNFEHNNDYIVINHTKIGKVDFEHTIQIYDYVALKSIDAHIRKFASLEQLLLIELLSACLVANKTKSDDSKTWYSQFCSLFSGKKQQYISFIESPHLKDSYYSMDIMLRSYLNSCHNSLPIQCKDPFKDLQSIR